MRSGESSPWKRGGFVRAQVPQDMLTAIHRRLLTKDKTAWDDLTEVLLEPLVGELSTYYRRVDEHVIRDAVIDALLDECAKPTGYDANRGVPLDRFLAAAARRNVRDLLRSEYRKKQRERQVAQEKKEVDVALDPAAANILKEVQEDQERKVQNLLTLVNDPRDRKILLLRMQGVRNTVEFARILGIEDHPLKQQRREVMRRKDRLRCLAQRHGFRSLLTL